MIELIDTHTHLYDKRFDSDIERVMEKAKERSIVKMVLPGIDSSYHKRMIERAKEFKGICYAAAGLHPTSVKKSWREELQFVEEAHSKERFIAVGEIGLDRYWSKEFIEEQQIVFEEQLKLASQKELPVIIHSRETTQPILESLKRLKRLNLRGLFHAFSGSYESYLELKKVGEFKIGIGGVVTFKNSNLKEVVARVPLEEIVLETDSPWLTPHPHRGERNEPSYLYYIAKEIAAIKRLSLEEVAATTTENAKNLFNFA